MAEYLDKAGAVLIISKLQSMIKDVDDKVETIEIPTSLSDLENDAGFQTAEQVSAVVTTAISNAQDVTPEIVENLPAAEDAQEGKIYFVATGNTEGDIYNEYIFINDKFEPLGGAGINLDTYVQKSEIAAITTEDILAMFN